MKINELRGKKILILGLGKEGLVTLKFLQKHLPDLQLGLADLRKLQDFDQETQDLLNSKERLGLHLGEGYLNDLKKYEIIIKSPGINPRKEEIVEAVAAGVVVTSATRLFFANRKGKVVGITGSKGKSTTSSLIYAVLKEGGLNTDLVGNIGKSALEYLDQDAPERVFVFEMSSYQLEDFDGSPDVAVLVSFFPDHLDYHGSLESYFAAKMQIISHLTPDTVVVYNAGSPEISRFVSEKLEKRENLRAFNDGKGSRVEDKAIWIDGKKLLDLEEIRLLGKHNLQNMLAAAEVGKIFGIGTDKIKKALCEFKGLEHRLEKVGTWKEITFFNDAISTTPESTIAGMEALEDYQIGTIFLGGLDRGYSFNELAKKVLEKKIKNVVIFPETGERIWQAIEQELASGLARNGLKKPKVWRVDKMEEAVKIAYQATDKKTVCLLSNASPSYNLFKNFEDKGKQFKDWVEKLGNE